MSWMYTIKGQPFILGGDERVLKWDTKKELRIKALIELEGQHAGDLIEVPVSLSIMYALAPSRRNHPSLHSLTHTTCRLLNDTILSSLSLIESISCHTKQVESDPHTLIIIKERES